MTDIQEKIKQHPALQKKWPKHPKRTAKAICISCGAELTDYHAQLCHECKDSIGSEEAEE